MPSQKSDLNVPLKVAILKSGHRQRAVAIETRIAETRLSEIVNQRGVPPTLDEKTALATFLGVPVADLFPPAPVGAKP